MEITNNAIADINHRHEQIINWLVMNPHLRLTDCASAFNYTLPWLSRLIHSDMFQARYQERCRELGVMCVHTQANSLRELGAAASAKALAILEDKPSERFVTDIFRETMAAMGYAPGGKSNGSGQTVVAVDARTIVVARERAAAALQGTAPRKIVDVVQVSADAPHDQGGEE